MPDCQAGHAPIAGRPFIVDVGQPERVPMCEFHGRIVQFGNAIVALLGRDHPAVVPVIVALTKAMDSDCLPGGGNPLPGTGAGEQSEDPLRGSSVPPCAGSLDGEAA